MPGGRVRSIAVAKSLAVAVARESGPERLRAREDAALIGLRRSSTFVPELESVRGIAVLLVFAFHVEGLVRFFPPTSNPIYLAFVRAGHTGVDLFFVLSAFLLSGPFLEDAAGGRRVNLRNFALRRALRILPLYYAAVIAGTVLRASTLGDLRHGLPYLFFLNSFAGIRTPLEPYSGVWWSLATEMQFYVLLPLLPLFLRSRRGRWAGLAVLCAYAVAYAVVVRGLVRMGSVDGQMALLTSVFGRGPLFLWGIAAAAFYRRFGDRVRDGWARTRWMRNGGADALLIALVIANAFFLQWLIGIGSIRQMGARDQPWHIVNGALWASMILVVLLAPLRTKRLVSNPVLGRLGVLSYSIYILHVPFMKKSLDGLRIAWRGTFPPAGWSPSMVVAVIVLTAACFGLAALTYRFIERPFLARKARIDS